MFLAGVAVLAVVAFDLGPPLPHNDDWFYGWEARHLIARHSLVLIPTQSALAVVQVFWSWLLTLGHGDQRLLRLSLVPLVVLTAYMARRTALRLGAGRAWSWVAAVTLLGTPVYLALGSSYMSEVPYLAILMSLCAFGTDWIGGGRNRAVCVVLCFLAPLQRQVGASIPIALTLALIRARRERRLERPDWLALAGAWLAAALAALLPVLTAVAPPTQGMVLRGASSIPLTQKLTTWLFLPTTLSLFLLPFMVGAFYAPPRRRSASLSGALLAVLGAISLIFFAPAIWTGGVIFPGTVWTREMLNGLLVCPFRQIASCGKNEIFPAWVFTPIELLAMLTIVVLFFKRRREWLSSATSASSSFLLFLATFQFLPLLLINTPVVDRYYLLVAAPLIPLLAAVCSQSRRQKLGLGWALLALTLGVVLYGVGQQDYQSAQVARDDVARMAYSLAPPGQINAGYEANAFYVELPAFERAGAPVDLAQGQYDLTYAIKGPAHPVLVLTFALRGDPRPGEDYWSLAPGRVVIARPDGSKP